MDAKISKKLLGLVKITKKANTAAIIVIFAAFLIMLNLIADRIPLKYDMTVEKIFSLSE